MSVCMATLLWRPHLATVGGGLLMLALAGGLIATYLLIRKRFPTRQALWLTAPRAGLLVLLLFAMLDPSCTTRSAATRSLQVMALLDTSESMDVAGAGEPSRRRRAEKLFEKIREKGQTEGLVFTRAPVDGDLGQCLSQLAAHPAPNSTIGILLLTDGGDERITPARLPDVPLYIQGVGDPRETSGDIAIDNVDAPVSVQRGESFDILVTLSATKGGGIAQLPDRIAIALEESVGDRWVRRGEADVVMNNGRGRHSFHIADTENPGTVRWRVQVTPVGGELTPLNNMRAFSVTVEDRSVRVLLFSLTQTWELTTLRRTLDREPGITLTSVSRVAGERYLVQGDRQPGDDALEAGFPSGADLLRRYSCVIIGSLPVSELSDDQRRALLEYVDEGGAAVFLGGEDAFTGDGSVATALGPLMPWAVLKGELPLIAGTFPVSLSPGATGHPVLSGGLSDLALMGELSLEGLNRVGHSNPALSGCSKRLPGGDL